MSNINSGDSQLDAAIRSWLKHDKNDITRQEVLDDVAAKNWDKLKKTMLERMKFGTAGLRGRMGAGYKCMNDVVILQTAQGLCSYLQKESCESRLKNGIVIGYDGRHNSKRFAELTARVFACNNIPVHLFFNVVPTPFVSFATIYYKAAGGIMVTASHNPKWDNGYKVYWGNGSQLLVPHDDNVLEEILNCLDIPDTHWDIDNIRKNSLVTDCYQEILDHYLEYLQDTLGDEVMKANKDAAIKVVYSAMHGVGHKAIVESFKACNLQPVISVPQQQDPDPDFPTADFPNPEEVKCLDLSKKLLETSRANETDVRLVLVNDPDADRLAVAEFDPCDNSWKVFTGNEMGTLLGSWVLTQREKRNVARCGPGDTFIIASVVSSKMLGAVVEGRGQFVQTLTGFKWMGNTTLLLLEQNQCPIFAFEEAIGYMIDPRLPDKDGVSAAVHVASLASKLYSEKSSLKDHLNSLYKQYGLHMSFNSYYICHDPVLTAKIFDRIRNYEGPGKYPKNVAGLEIVSLNDLAAGVQVPGRGLMRKLSVLGTGLDLDYRSGEMIMFSCSNGLSAMLRTSGTEPKIKFYTEMVYKSPSLSEDDMRSEMKDMVRKFVEELLEPKKNGLKAQGEE